ncbi:hypothetical protein [Armatimonas sp.]|uniref:hypothetical protein n=1 Tax=Armatimonas sp. TaxID=1872638 RepID=UPI00374CC380
MSTIALALSTVTTTDPEQPWLSATRQGLQNPNPHWTRGTCPLCGSVVVSYLYYVKSQGYVVVWFCWNSLPAGDLGISSEEPELVGFSVVPLLEQRCDYRRVL